MRQLGESFRRRSCSTRDDVAEVAAGVYVGASDGTISNKAGQLWALRGRIKPGDLLAMPLKTTSRIALGRVVGPYEYRVNEVRSPAWNISSSTALTPAR